MRFKLNIKSFYRKKLFPFFLLAFLFDLNFYKNVGLANVELRPASEEDINLYVNSYSLSLGDKGIRAIKTLFQKLNKDISLVEKDFNEFSKINLEADSL